MFGVEDMNISQSAATFDFCDGMFFICEPVRTFSIAL